MRVDKLVVPKLNSIKTFKMKDFAKYSEVSPNLDIDKEIKTANYSITLLKKAPDLTENAYFVGNRLFVYTSDNFIYEYKNYSFVKLEECLSMPKLFAVIIDGKEEILVITDQAYILGKNQIKFTLPSLERLTNYNNRLFYSNKKNIYFSDAFDVGNFTMDISNSGYISVPSRDGTIVELVSYEDNLFVFCKQAIYVLNISVNDDFTFTRCNTCALNIMDKSVAKVGNEIFFISDNRLCSYKNGKVEIQQTNFENMFQDSALTAIGYKENYAIIFSTHNQNNVYMFDTINRRDYVLTCQRCEFIGDKYLYDSVSNQIYQFNNKNLESKVWTSKTIDFGVHYKKAITEIGMYASSNALFYVFSDCGNSCFTLKQGNNYIKLNLEGKRFYFRIFPSSQDVLLKDFQIKYRIIGE